MRETTWVRKSPDEKLAKDIKWVMRKHYLFKDKIRIVLDGLWRYDNISELCSHEGISQGI